VRIALAGAVALPLLAGGAELAARELIRDRVGDAAGRSVSGDLAVDFGDGPALTALTGRHLDWVTVHGDAVGLGRVRGAELDVRLTDVQPGDSVGRSHAEVRLPTASVLATAQSAVHRLPVTDAVADPAAGTFRLTVGRGGLGQVTVRPEVRGGRVAMDVTGAEFLGMAAPEGLLDRLRENVGDPVGDDPEGYPLGLAVTTLTVGPDGLYVALDGGPSPLGDAAG
jgi:hypothetical protein